MKYLLSPARNSSFKNQKIFVTTLANNVKECSMKGKLFLSFSRNFKRKSLPGKKSNCVKIRFCALQSGRPFRSHTYLSFELIVSARNLCLLLAKIRNFSNWKKLLRVRNSRRLRHVAVVQSFREFSKLALSQTR